MLHYMIWAAINFKRVFDLAQVAVYLSGKNIVLALKTFRISITLNLFIL